MALRHAAFAPTAVRHGSSPRNPRIAVHAAERDVAAIGQGGLARAQVTGDHVPDRLALLRVDRGPARDLVALAGFERLAAVELQLGNAVADAFGRRADGCRPPSPA